MKSNVSRLGFLMLLIVSMVLLGSSASAELNASINVDFSTASIIIGDSSLVLVDVSGYGGLVTSKLEVYRGDSLEYSDGLMFQMSDFTIDDWKVHLQNTQEGLHSFRFTITDSGGETAEASMDVYVSAGGLSILDPSVTDTPAPMPTFTPTPTPMTTPSPTPTPTSMPTPTITPIQFSIDILLDRNVTNVANGESVTATAVTQGGDAPYQLTYDWTIFEGSSVVFQTGHTSSSFITPKFGDRGKVAVSAQDSNGQLAYAEAEFTITGSPKPLRFLLSYNKSTVDINKGEYIKLFLEEENAVEPFYYNGSFFITENDIERYDSSINLLSSGETSFTPGYGSSGRFSIYLADGIGRSISKQVEFDITGGIDAEPFTLDVELSKSVVDIDKHESITASVNAKGGTPPYRYRYNWTVSEGGQDYSSLDWCYESKESSTSFMPIYGESGNITVAAEDSLGRKTHVQKNFSISGGNGPLKLVLSLDKQSLDIGTGETITATMDVSGGIPPYRYWFTWYTTEDVEEESSQSAYEISESTNSFNPTSGNNGRLYASVRDSTDRGTSKEALFLVFGSLPEPTPTPVPSQTPKGDANGDNAIDILDLVSIIDCIVSNTTPASPTNADANSDGTVDILDFVWIIDQIVGV